MNLCKRNIIEKESWKGGRGKKVCVCVCVGGDSLRYLNFKELIWLIKTKRLPPTSLKAMCLDNKHMITPFQMWNVCQCLCACTCMCFIRRKEYDCGSVHHESHFTVYFTARCHQQKTMRIIFSNLSCNSVFHSRRITEYLNPVSAHTVFLSFMVLL